MTDTLIAVWIAAAGISFVLPPLAAVLMSSNTWAAWATGVWDAWRFPYGVVLVTCAAGAALRACRYVLAARRHEEWQDQR